MKVKCKIWIEDDGKVFGKGPYEILKAVDQLGSLNKAAKHLNMSYNKAFTLIKNIEKRLKYQLIERQTGGLKGGGSYVTDAGKDLIHKYEVLVEKAENNIDILFQEIFLEQ